MKGRRILQIGLFILTCVGLDILLHAATSAFGTTPDHPVLSGVSQLFGMELSATLWALAAFSGEAALFLILRDGIPGKGIRKGLHYGAAVALLWLMGMLEGTSLFGNALIREFVVGLSDALPAFLLGLLLGSVEPGKKESISPAIPKGRKPVKTVCLFMGSFTLGRYLAYSTGIIRSGMLDRPWLTLIWTLMMGLTVGVAFLLVTSRPREDSLPVIRPRLGFLLFGWNWVSFLCFMPLMFDGYLTDVLLRIAIDLVTVIITLIVIGHRQWETGGEARNLSVTLNRVNNQEKERGFQSTDGSFVDPIVVEQR